MSLKPYPPSTDRRALSFPAVHPCEAISQATLLASLITLSQNICNFQSNSFITQRRNAKETARQITILLLFFQEIQGSGSVIPNDVVLCFSELHLTFQKIHFLMQDCAREGSRLWMLMKSQYVAAQFRVLIRAMATALDVLPLHTVEACGEVKELVELVTKQARKGKFELDPDDERQVKHVHSVLDKFERGIEPHVDTIKGIILDYLKITNWSDCNKEIKFLEDQIRGAGAEVLSCGVPEDFRCPISLELMTDPVTVSTGQTYNRASIQKWLKAGNMICPKTLEKLTTTELLPNTMLKKLIQQFCSDNNISITKSSDCNRNIARTIEPGSPASAHAMQFLSWFLSRRLVFGTEEQKKKAAFEIRLLARSNIFNRACLVEMGTVPPLLDLLATDDRTTQENAIAALMKLSKHNSGQKIIMDSRGLAPILKVLKRGHSLEARQVAGATIFYLSSVKEYRKIIGENPEAIPALVEMIKEGTTCGKKNAVVAIFGLLLFPRNHPKVLEAGAVPALVGVLASSDKADLITDCLAVLVALAGSVEGANGVLQASALPLVTGILQSATSRAGKEHCVSILLSLCVNVGADVLGVLAKDPSLMPLLYSLLTNGTPHAAKKARSLIKVLQEFNEKKTYGSVESSVSPQRLVHLS
ncbi:U-box domain-containing protein 19-like [Gastrolobium bilobum]|uniref:U-box domain-containing protein 19-like n=1 Tax=Gastrolobium bilobum TaxID=150636 RepID=UPI002AB02DF2|nr:U-box domain-containing protein 19-like [Gastrolobium bilobum]